jgi:hypothetical protein
MEFRPQKQAFGPRGLTKPKIPLQLYDVFMVDWSNRPRGLTKRHVRKPNRSRGSTKQKIPLQLYALFDPKTTLKP